MPRILFTVALFFSVAFSSGQEVLTGLQFNPVVQERSRELKMLKSASAGEDTIPITMPFFDDFSKGGVYPSPLRWIDFDTYVNTDFPVFPPNIGAVTFDAVTDSGNMYPEAVPGPQTFIADHLTSRFIRLDSVFDPSPKALTPADSVYLSFYYQPQGRGLDPNNTDSLVLHFLVSQAHDSITPTDTIPIPDRWQWVWSSTGMPLDTFIVKNNTYFKQVMIPIRDPRFFKKEFRFQFFNYVSLASSALPSWQSNCDEWNVDNIYLDKGRNVHDTIRPEIRFIDRVPSMLKDYTSMPYRQYCDDPTNEMADTLDLLMSNRDISNHNCDYGYSISSQTGSFFKTYDGGQHVVQPFYQFGYVTYIPYAHPPVSFLLPVVPADSASFSITHHIRSLDGGTAYGDTITATQHLYNYYAYDDGSPEAGYGLRGTGGMMALRFHLNLSPDTLRAINIFFNRTLGHVNQQYFYLTVWNDNSGKPGDTIYSRLAYPTYTDTLNKFYMYHLEIPLRITGDFYIGTIQTTDDNLNIGFDRYDDASKNLYFNVTGQWQASAFSGSLLMRPYVGKPIPTGIPEAGPQDTPGKLVIYPNPSPAGTVHVGVTGTGGSVPTEAWTVEVSNLYGSVVRSDAFTGLLDVSRLAPGLYVVHIKSPDGNSRYAGKLVITR
ncbi:MAG TPA: T9SS type A sorting domain-containing protein [Bacteroidales bacterium]|nr:T9SS type A sorting domain-containing protein [Bacteroidales bacterium]